MKGKLKNNIDTFEGEPEREGKERPTRGRRECRKKGSQIFSIVISPFPPSPLIPQQKNKNTLKFIVANQFTTFYPIYNPNPKIIVTLPKKLLLIDLQ